MDVRQEFRTVHGHRRAYLYGGAGPALLFIHGIGDSSRTWLPVLPLLAQHYTVIAPDLLGHGDSDKPRADYSVGGFANGMRDLLTVLDHECATIVGHSLGGGVALQFAYQYPEMCERLVLIASGGLGAEVTPLLRAAAAPGAGFLIGASVRLPLRVPIWALMRLARAVGLLDSHDAHELLDIWSGLRDPSTRSAFLRTLRSVVDLRGQSVSSRDRLYLAAATPMLLVWGSKDPVLPVDHARTLASELDACRLEIVSGAGHLPHHADPERVALVLRHFTEQTLPATHDPASWRQLLGAAAATA
ncbi:MAG: alpha/beta fold hydrolase [Mycobacteriales bacterium]